MRSTARTGRIPSSEWPEIVARREKGETYAAIARDYGVTGPAIKYIVDKAQAGEVPAEEAAEDAVEGQAESADADADPAATQTPQETGDKPAPRGRLGLGEKAGRAPADAGEDAAGSAAGPETGTAEARDAAAEPEGEGEERPAPRAEVKRPASASDVDSPLAQRVMETAADCAAMIERFESGDRGPAVDEGLKKSIHLLRRAIAAVEIERDRAAAPPPFRHQQSRPQAQSAQTGPSGKLPVPPKPAAAPSESQLSGDTVEGTVKFFHADKGFGFVIPDDGGSDIYVPLRALKSSGLSSLQAEQRVRVSVVSGAKGPEANEVEPVAA